MSEIALPPGLTDAEVRALARAFIRTEAYVPKGDADPALSTLLKVSLKFVHDSVVMGHTEAEWDRFQAKVFFIVNPSLTSASMIPPGDVRIILRPDLDRVSKLLRPLLDLVGLEKPGEAGYG